MVYLLGLIVGLSIVLVISHLAAKKIKDAKNQKNTSISGITEFPIATIAKDLKPLFSPYVKSNKIKKISVVGDGYYAISENKKYWLDCLEEWLEAGVIVEYILVDPQSSDSSGLEKLKLDYADLFKIHRCYTNDSDERVSEIAELFTTLHPTLIYGEKNEENGLWLELFHPKQSCFSFDNTFVPPGHLDEEYLSLFNDYDCYIKDIVNLDKSKQIGKID